MRSLPIPVWGGGGNQIIAWAKVSDEDYQRMKQHRWYLSDGYVVRTMYRPDGSKTSISMHRDLMSVEHGDVMEVDHVNRDRLDNRRENLRLAERWENERNHEREEHYSRKVGVTFDESRSKWKAQASLDGMYVYLGLYEQEETAIIARLRWEAEHGRLHSDDLPLIRELMASGVLATTDPLSSVTPNSGDT